MTKRIDYDDMALRAKPCPFCGERLTVLSDHHGEWLAHRDAPATKCFEAVAQVHDEDDLAEWNTRKRDQPQ